MAETDDQGTLGPSDLPPPRGPIPFSRNFVLARWRSSLRGLLARVAAGGPARGSRLPAGRRRGRIVAMAAVGTVLTAVLVVKVLISAGRSSQKNPVRDKATWEGASWLSIAVSGRDSFARCDDTESTHTGALSNEAWTSREHRPRRISSEVRAALGAAEKQRPAAGDLLIVGCGPCGLAVASVMTAQSVSTGRSQLAL